MGCGTSKLQISNCPVKKETPKQEEDPRVDFSPSDNLNNHWSQSNGCHISFSSFMNQDNPHMLYYSYIEMIAQGLYSKIFKVKNQKNKKNYAAIVYNTEILHKTQTNNNFTLFDSLFEEIQVLGLLHHENCIELIEILEDEETNSISLITTYAEKGSLLTQNSPIPHPESFAKPIFHQILKAVQYIHHNNIVHRDIRADKILFISEDKVILGGFSKTKSVESDEQTLEDSVGCPLYFSPEICSGNPYHPKPADIWALGITLYFIIYGHVPFYDIVDDGLYISQFYQVSQDIQMKDIPYDQKIEISPELSDLFHHILDKDPSSRYTADQILEHPWLSK